VVRHALRRVLESDPEITVAGEVGDGGSVVELARRLHPTVVLMDLVMPGVGGIEATRRIARGGDSTNVLVLSMHADPIYVHQALRAGARGYVTKDADDFELIRAVKAVARGESFLGTATPGVVLDAFLHPPPAPEPAPQLTRREREVLRLIAEGQTNVEIAATLSLSINTVASHRKRAMEKFDLHNAADVVRYAVRERLVT
jgi:DNA-binding NarL/FixJ family response regulator